MKSWKWLFAIAAVLTLFALPCRVKAGIEVVPTTYQLFKGNTTVAKDTLEMASPWIPVRGANRILIRTWSQGQAAYTGADSVYCDSILTFKVLFSDSVSFMGRDSLGTLVTARSTSGFSTTGAFPVCADSVMITGAENALTPDTTRGKFVAVSNVPLQKSLRAGASGSGHYTLVVPVIPPGGASIYGDGSITAQYMRVRVTALNRLTLAGAVSTAGIRTRGINGLRMEAMPIYKNK